jgi:hypothetical protein
LQSATILQLPRVATIHSLVGDGRPYTRDHQPIHPWTSGKCAPGALREGLRCQIALLNQAPHVQVEHKLGQPGVYDCRKRVPQVPPRGTRDSTFSPDYEGPILPLPSTAPPRGTGDSVFKPDYEGPICAGVVRDPFPSTTVYVRATFVDPQERHFDRVKKTYVVGPVVSKIYYQFAGIRRLPRGEGGNR